MDLKRLCPLKNPLSIKIKVFVFNSDFSEIKIYLYQNSSRRIRRLRRIRRE
jgi:hypothetical protein